MSPPLGLYLGTETIDLLSLTGSFQQPKLFTFARTRLPSESQWRNRIRVEGPETAPPTSQPVTEPTEGVQAIGRVLQAVLPKLGITTAQAHVALPSEAVVIRYFQMPTIPTYERKMAIAFEAKKYLPFKLEELISDYEIVIRRTDPTVMRVMFFGIKKSSIDTYLSLFQTAGITPVCLEPAPLSLMRLVRHTGQIGAGQVAAILYVEHDSATISIARNDVLYLSRNVSIAANVEGGEEPSQELLDALVNETRVSIDYYRRRFLGEPTVTKVLVFGKTLENKRVEELSTALSLPVEATDPFAKILGAKTVPPGLAVAAGLALRGLEKKAREINLLPPRQRRQAETTLKPLMWEAAAALLILAGWYSLSVMQLGALENRLSTLRTQQPWPQGISRTSSLSELHQFRANRDQEVRLLKQLKESTLPPSKLLASLSKQMPQETWLQYLLFRDVYRADTSSRRRFLRLLGSVYANNRDAEIERVNQLLATLRRDPLYQTTFKEFSLNSVQRARLENQDVTEFALSCATRAEDLRLESESGNRGR